MEELGNAFCKTHANAFKIEVVLTVFVTSARAAIASSKSDRISVLRKSERIQASIKRYRGLFEPLKQGLTRLVDISLRKPRPSDAVSLLYEVGRLRKHKNRIESCLLAGQTYLNEVVRP